MIDEIIYAVVRILFFIIIWVLIKISYNLSKNLIKKIKNYYDSKIEYISIKEFKEIENKKNN